MRRSARSKAFFPFRSSFPLLFHFPALFTRFTAQAAPSCLRCCALGDIFGGLKALVVRGQNNSQQRGQDSCGLCKGYWESLDSRRGRERRLRRRGSTRSPTRRPCPPPYSRRPSARLERGPHGQVAVKGISGRAVGKDPGQGGAPIDPLAVAYKILVLVCCCMLQS
jgi:hypothetical protein